MKTNRFLSLIAVGAGLAIAAPALAQESAPAKKPTEHTQPAHQDKPIEKHTDKVKEATGAKSTGLDVGAAAPDFKLKDTDGKEVSLASLSKEGKVVVLFWFNPDCPFVKKHFTGDHKTFNDLAAKYRDKNVAVIAINSGSPGKEGAGLERNAKAKKDWNIGFPILMDETGATGKAYGAKNTPFTVVVGKDGKVAYMGAIDDNDGADAPGKTNYAAKAVDEVLAGTNVTTPKTKPYGCKVKYAKD